MIVVGIVVIAALVVVAATIWLVYLGFGAGELNRRIDTAADCRWEELGRLSHLP